MSTNYKISDEVPSDIICKRLNELSDAVTKGNINREFDMRIPAEVDRDADLILSGAASRIQSLTQQNEDKDKSIKAVREAVWQAKNGFSLIDTDGYIDDALELLNELTTPSA